MNHAIPFQYVLITGGAGFVGGSLATRLREWFPQVSVHCLDNLKRRGSELNLPRLRHCGVTFQHGDIRCPEDVEACPPFDLLIDCSAEPSVQAGIGGSPLPVIQNNLAGTVHCLEAARRRSAAFLFISTSRVYPIEAINRLAYREDCSRFVWTAEDPVAGFSEKGIAEQFPLDGARSLYGATKLAAELLLQEYAYSYRLPALINRCGLLAGPWQMGKVDQGVVTLWVARHTYGMPLKYIGFGGQGKQVRDMLHIDDLFELLVRQCGVLSAWDGRAYNVGGGHEVSASLLELTDLCRQVTGRAVPIHKDVGTSPVDVRIYVSDSSRAATDFGWGARRDVRTIVQDIYDWLQANEDSVRPVLAA